MRMMPTGWGAPEEFFLKYLRALKSNPEPSLEDVLSAEDGMKTPRTRNEFIRQYNLPLDYFTTDNDTRAKYNDAWRKRKALTLPKKPELYVGSKDVPQPVTMEYPLPPILFDLSKIPGYGEGDKMLPARVERADNTRVQKPITGIIPTNSEVRTYDNVPVRVSKNYPLQDKYYLGNPARPMYSRDKNIKLNGIYPSAYGVELDVLAPEYIQKINGNDTTYYIQGGDLNYYPVAGLQSRPAFREAFKNLKARGNRPNYFNTPEKIDKVKRVITNWQK